MSLNGIKVSRKGLWVLLKGCRMWSKGFRIAGVTWNVTTMDQARYLGDLECVTEILNNL